MRINCYGEEAVSETVGTVVPRAPLEERFAGGWTYQRFGAGEMCAIHRLGVCADGVVRETWARGRWDEAESLDYRPLTETMEVMP